MVLSSIDMDISNLPKLLQLPLELRQQIYSYLCPPSPISNPIPTVGITCVSHRPPPISFLLSSHAINSDVQDYYHSLASWKLIASHAFNFYRIDPTLSNLASSRLLKRLQKVELVFWFDGSLLKSYPSLKQRTYCDEIKKRATRACEILATAKQLKVVQVSWVDTVTDTDVEEKLPVLESLSKLGKTVRFEIGCLEWSNAQASQEKDLFEMKVRSHIDAVHLAAPS
ncbi:hypothetical protein D6D24_08822 [Aureobasidium pullulans]|uniref:Uncharacterized protein n=1 Tax=Aureobasidium pullulans TaxID=5580 RepID=A0A4S8VBL8_AURPU|nr:hypothetical protein D6D24_08822 [Aureobasidium pullulans]